MCLCVRYPDILRTLLIPCLSSRFPFVCILVGSTRKDHSVTICPPCRAVIFQEPPRPRGSSPIALLTIDLNISSWVSIAVLILVLVTYAYLRAFRFKMLTPFHKKKQRGQSKKRLTGSSDGWFLNPSGWLKRDALFNIIIIPPCIFASLHLCSCRACNKRCLSVVFRSSFPSGPHLYPCQSAQRMIPGHGCGNGGNYVHLQQEVGVSHGRDRRMLRDEEDSGEIG